MVMLGPYECFARTLKFITACLFACCLGYESFEFPLASKGFCPQIKMLRANLHFLIGLFLQDSGFPQKLFSKFANLLLWII